VNLQVDTTSVSGEHIIIIFRAEVLPRNVGIKSTRYQPRRSVAAVCLRECDVSVSLYFRNENFEMKFPVET
jgi:hypothetical protein